MLKKMLKVLLAIAFLNGMALALSWDAMLSLYADELRGDPIVYEYDEDVWTKLWTSVDWLEIGEKPMERVLKKRGIVWDGKNLTIDVDKLRDTVSAKMKFKPSMLRNSKSNPLRDDPLMGIFKKLVPSNLPPYPTRDSIGRFTLPNSFATDMPDSLSYLEIRYNLAIKKYRNSSPKLYVWGYFEGTVMNEGARIWDLEIGNEFLIVYPVEGRNISLDSYTATFLEKFSGIWATMMREPISYKIEVALGKLKNVEVKEGRRLVRGCIPDKKSHSKLLNCRDFRFLNGTNSEPEETAYKLNSKTWKPVCADTVANYTIEDFESVSIKGYDCSGLKYESSNSGKICKKDDLPFLGYYEDVFERIDAMSSLCVARKNVKCHDGYFLKKLQNGEGKLLGLACMKLPENSLEDRKNFSFVCNEGYQSSLLRQENSKSLDDIVFGCSKKCSSGETFFRYGNSFDGECISDSVIVNSVRSDVLWLAKNFKEKWSRFLENFRNRYKIYRYDEVFTFIQDNPDEMKEVLKNDSLDWDNGFSQEFFGRKLKFIEWVFGSYDFEVGADLTFRIRTTAPLPMCTAEAYWELVPFEDARTNLPEFIPGFEKEFSLVDTDTCRVPPRCYGETYLRSLDSTKLVDDLVRFENCSRQSAVIAVDSVLPALRKIASDFQKEISSRFEMPEENKDVDLTLNENVDSEMEASSEPLVNADIEHRPLTKSQIYTWRLISALAILGGGALAYYGDYEAKKERDRGLPTSNYDFKNRKDVAESFQLARLLGFVAAGVGVASLSISFFF